MAFAHNYPALGRFYVYYTDREGFIQIDQYRRSADPNRADPGSRRSVIRVPHPHQPQGRPAAVRPRRIPLRGLRGRWRRRGPRDNGRNLSRKLAKPIRIDPKPDGGYTIPRSTIPSESCRRAPGDLRVRAAQSVPVLLRPPYPEASRSATSARTRSRRSTSSPAAGRPPPRGGYNFGWDSFEGRNRYESGSAPGRDIARPPAHARAGLLLDHGRLRDPRPLARARLDRALRLRRLLRRHPAPRDAAPPQRAHEADADAREQAGVLRRGQPRARLRRLARRAGVSNRQAVARKHRAVPGAPRGSAAQVRPDRLVLEVGLQALAAVLAADARRLEAAERRGRVGRAPGVDVDVPARSSAASRWAVATSRVQTPAARPYSVSLARRATSSSDS